MCKKFDCGEYSNSNVLRPRPSWAQRIKAKPCRRRKKASAPISRCIKLVCISLAGNPDVIEARTTCLLAQPVPDMAMPCNANIMDLPVLNGTIESALVILALVVTPQATSSCPTLIDLLCSVQGTWVKKLRTIDPKDQKERVLCRKNATRASPDSK